MPGAVIALDQDRPGPTVSAGSPGISRKDLWVGHTIHPRCTTSGNASFSWTLLDQPLGASVTVTNSDQVACAVTPVLPGSYRLQLVTNGGGPGNIQILAFRVRFDSSGASVQRGWALPALGESPGESNYPVDAGNNVRGYDDPVSFIFDDILPFIELLPFTKDVVLVAGNQVGGGTPAIVASRGIDLVQFPATLGGKVLHAAFLVTLSSSDTGVVGQAQLYEQDSGYTVTSTLLDNSGATSVTTPQEFSSGYLVLGAEGSGHLVNTGLKQYNVIIAMTSGTNPQFITCHGARVVLSYL